MAGATPAAQVSPVDDDDPAAHVAAVFDRIAETRMAGLPLCNPALRVESVGFRRWEGVWLGALITPWSISLMLLPGGSGTPDVRFSGLQPGQKRDWRFPSGEYRFLANREPGLGDYQLCSLYSPVFEFPAQAEARTMACAALEALFADEARLVALAACAGGHGGEGVATRAPLDRRGFLRAMLAGGRR